MKEYKIGEVFRHTDGKAYQCVEGETCKRCAFGSGEYRCAEVCIGPRSRTDGRSVIFTEVTGPSDGMLFRAEDGKMYQLKYGEPSSFGCACNAGMYGCGCLNEEVFGDDYLPEWYWAPVEEDAPAPVEPPKPPEPPKRHIELGVVKVEGDNVTFRIVEQTHRCDEFSQQDYPREFKACNGIRLMSFIRPQWLSFASALYCRGSDSDDSEITSTTVEFVKIFEAITEYNATDGMGYKKQWPKKGDKYFCIAADGRVVCITFEGYEFNRKMQAFGNLFRTKEEAEVAVEQVKQVLKSKNGAEK